MVEDRCGLAIEESKQMSVRDIVEQEVKGTSIPLTVAAPAPKESRGRGKAVAGRYVPSKQLKTQHRRSRSTSSLKEFARQQAKIDPASADWLRIKAAAR
jgi:hypothetical protein